MMSLQGLTERRSISPTGINGTKVMPLPAAAHDPSVEVLPLKMDSSFLGEETGKIFGNNVNVQYLNETQREKFRVSIKNGKIVDCNGKPLDTRDVVSENGDDNHRAIFVMDVNGEVYISKFKAKGFFQHSSLLGGEDVLAAGYIEIRDGVIKALSRKSGHYKTPLVNLHEFMRRLRNLGALVHDDFYVDDKI